MPATSNPLGSALFGATRQAVLRLFFSHPDERFYQRQVIRTVGLGSGTVQRELDLLAKTGILTRSVGGHQIYYQANSESPIFGELRGLIRKTFGVGDVLRAALDSIAPKISVAFVYGSVARGSEKSGSDIDLIIIGDNLSLDTVVPVLSDAQTELAREVNPSIYSMDEFRRKLTEGNHFLTSVAKEPKLFLIGNEHEFERLVEKRVAQRAQNKPGRDCGPARRRR
jgi:predicted nucleotidyltransferase